MAHDPKPTGQINYGFGQLNSIREQDSFSLFDPATSKAIDTLRNVCSEQFTPDILAGSGNFKGVCLRVDLLTQKNVAGSWMENVFGIGAAPGKPFLAVKVRIPELHACLPSPFIEQQVDQKIVNMYPTFIAVDSSLSQDEPSPGDIVNVGFGDKVNMADPIYYGKVFAQPIGPPLQTSSKGAFQKSGNKDVSQIAGPFLPDSNTQVKATQATARALKAGLSEDDDCIQNNGFGEWCAWNRMEMLGKKEFVEIGGWSDYANRPNVLEANAAKAFKEMQAAASAAGHRIKVNSGFRSMPHQTELYQKYLRKGSPITAVPGKSNHQNGSAVDIAGTNDGTRAGKWGVPGHNTSLYLWLKQHAHEYGFVRSVRSESWHWLYKGVGVAATYRKKRWRRYVGGGLNAWLRKKGLA